MRWTDTHRCRFLRADTALVDAAVAVLQLLMKLFRGAALTENVALDVLASLLLATRCTLLAQYRPSLISVVRHAGRMYKLFEHVANLFNRLFLERHSALFI